MIYDYFLIPGGFELRLFGIIRIARVKRTDIPAAHVIEGMCNFGATYKLGMRPWNVWRLGNRFARRWVLVEKRGWPNYFAMTPRGPSQFVDQMLDRGGPSTSSG
jgi:hypothetical protein